MRSSVLRRLLFKFMVSLAIYAIAAAVFAQGKSGQHGGKGDDDEKEGQHQNQTSIMWINHLDLLPGDPTVITSFNAVSSGVGSGLSGLIIMSTTTGDPVAANGNLVVTGGGNKVVEKVSKYRRAS